MVFHSSFFCGDPSWILGKHLSTSLVLVPSLVKVWNKALDLRDGSVLLQDEVPCVGLFGAPLVPRL